ncbi:MAG: hypothetical protein ACRCXZ_09480 [Patescibacteria group bacterium]
MTRIQFQPWKSFIIDEKLYEFTHFDTSNKYIQDVLTLAVTSGESSSKPIIRLVKVDEDNEVVSSEFVQISAIVEDRERFVVPLYSGTPAKVVDFDVNFKIVTTLTAKYLGPADTGRQGDCVMA